MATATEEISWLAEYADSAHALAALAEGGGGGRGRGKSKKRRRGRRRSQGGEVLRGLMDRYEIGNKKTKKKNKYRSERDYRT